MRNWVSAAHPNQNEITGLQISNWFETCYKEVLSLPISNVSISIKRFLTNLKKTHLQKESADSQQYLYASLSTKQFDKIALALFGIYTREETENFVRNNIRIFLKVFWTKSSELIKKDIGLKLAYFSVNQQYFSVNQHENQKKLQNFAIFWNTKVTIPILRIRSIARKRREISMTKILVPPIKCQGIKTKLVPLILFNAGNITGGKWIEPFMGSCVVGLNARCNHALFTDQNPHLVNFYSALQKHDITPEITRNFLEKEGLLLVKRGEQHYYDIRTRFNEKSEPLDFLFLSRACFNGLIRFNSKGKFNVPFCRKPERFVKAYITKIVNQIAHFQEATRYFQWDFVCSDFEETILQATADDIIYCDPPYLGRHVDYFDSWSEKDENRLFRTLSNTKAKFILSTWHSNQYRENETLKKLWNCFHIVTQEHFYHVGAKESNRSAMLEALVMNFVPRQLPTSKKTIQKALLFK